jgi:hypothetical protein
MNASTITLVCVINGNSEMATDATRWLLDIREELQQ